MQQGTVRRIDMKKIIVFLTAADDDMMQRSGRIYAGFTGHGLFISYRSDPVNI
jgi:hypothetical protein